VKLADVIAAMTPLVAGHASPEETAARLGIAPRGLDVYAHLGNSARTSLLAGMFPHCRHAVVTRFGEARWDAIVAAFFDAHPERHYLRRMNARAFLEFARVQGVLPWLADLADFEWTEWDVDRASPDPRDADAAHGSLRVASTLALRRYDHDVVRWIDEAERRGDPRAEPVVCAFWQDASGASFRNVLGAPLLSAIDAVRRGDAPDAAALEELRGAEIVLGAG
jgi:hypothetical protein